MLQQKYLKPTERLFRVYSAINFIPFDFDPKTGEAKPHSSWWRHALWALNVLLCAALFIFMNVRLLESLLYPERFNPAEFPFRFSFTTFLSAGICFAFILFHVHASTTMTLYNEVRQNLLKEFKQTSSPRAGKRTRVDMQECILIMFPWLLLPSGAFMLILCVIDPGMLQFPHELVPEEYQTTAVLLLNAVISWILYNVSYAAWNFCIFLHVGTFRFCFKEIQRLKQSYGDCDETDGDEVIAELRKQHLITRIFNESQGTLVFTSKANALFINILTNFFWIRYMKTYPIPAAYSLYISCHCFMTFLSAYNNAFAIPQQAEEVKRLVMLSETSGDGTRQLFMRVNRRLLWSKQIRSLPVLGIKNGRFQYMERGSTLAYLDFMVDKTASLLVSMN